MKPLLKKAAARLAHRLLGTSFAKAEGDKAFALVRFTRPDGSFDYDRYKAAQVEANKRKIDNVWVLEPNIAYLCDYIKSHLGQPKFGLCHGTRRGDEQAWFRKYLGCEVIGTEISDTATQFPNTIQWDFHDVKPEWVNAVDFIYSNAFDHSYDPEACLNAWMSCIRLGGLCILEHTSRHGPRRVTETDPFGAELVVMPYLIATWGKGRYAVREILPGPERSRKLSYLNFIVISRF